MMISGELATKLTGRHVEFEMFTLSFSECLGMKAFLGKPVADVEGEFRDYLTYGGFPQALEFDDKQAKAAYVTSVVNQIFNKDIKGYRKIRNRDAFDRVTAFVINNYSAPISLANIVEHFRKVERVSIKRETLAAYLRLLENAKLVYKCPRFDLKTRKSLRGGEKYYLADPGIYFARNIDTRINYGPALENAMYLHLRASGYDVSTGSIGGAECDFIAKRHDSYAYVQVSMSIADPDVEEREYRPFSRIKDNYPQFLLTLDPLLLKRDGVTHLNLTTFLQSDGEL